MGRCFDFNYMIRVADREILLRQTVFVFEGEEILIEELLAGIPIRIRIKLEKLPDGKEGSWSISPDGASGVPTWDITLVGWSKALGFGASLEKPVDIGAMPNGGGVITALVASQPAGSVNIVTVEIAKRPRA